MSKIYISVKGGCITQVWSTNAKDKIELWDWDNIENECFDFHHPTTQTSNELQTMGCKALANKTKTFEKLTKKLHIIF